GLAGVVGRYGVGLAVGANHVLTVKYTLDNLAQVILFGNRRHFFVVTNQTNQQLVGGCQISLGLLNQCPKPLDLFICYVCHVCMCLSSTPKCLFVSTYT